MKLPAQIGPYVVEREIGRGGMGVVYSGRDTRLDRAVAVKALPAELAADTNRLARLEREARVLASLSHPNIAALYGLEEQGGSKYLVMEMIEGETLADRLRRGPLPVDEAIQACEQIAQGLEAAHDAGVIHRDLKPGNIKVLPDGRVKILDFGLAKETVARPSSSADVTTSPTANFTAPATAAGQIMGTPGYLSPEQARGKPLDKRTDIWSFGCVLYECLTGQMCFGGETVSDTIAAVLERDPDLRRLPERTPARVRDLLSRCLEKQAKNRLRDIGDARIELAQAMATRAWSTTAIAQAAPARRRGLLWAFVWFAMLLALALLFRTPLGRAISAALHPGASRPVTRLSMNLAAPLWFERSFCLSPDGSVLAYISQPAQSAEEATPPRLYLRRLDSYDAVAVPGSDGAVGGIAFSPSGRWVSVCRTNPDGSRYALCKAQVDAPTEPVTKVSETGESRFRHIAWLSDDLLLFDNDLPTLGFWTIPAGGGEPTQVFDGSTRREYFTIDSVSSLPDGARALVTVSVSDAKGYHQDTYLLDTRAGALTPLLDGAHARLLTTGHVLYSRGETLFAAPFDASRARVTGPGTPVLSGVRAHTGYAAQAFDVSRDGRLVCVATTGADAGRRIMSVDRAGAARPLSTTRAGFEDTARVSPDGSMVCGSVIGENGAYQLYVCSVATGAVRILTLPGWESVNPAWSPDSQRIAFAATASDKPGRIMIRRADGSDVPSVVLQLTDLGIFTAPNCFSPDGASLLTVQYTRGQTNVPYQLVELATGRATTLLSVLATNIEPWIRLSGDGKFAAYVSGESGRGEVYLRRAPNADGSWPDEARVLVSAAGGESPRWAKDTNELFYVEPPGTLCVTRVAEGPALGVTPPQRLFATLPLDAQTGFDPAPDGKSFAFVQHSEGERRVTQLSVVDNWFKELRAKLESAGAK